MGKVYLNNPNAKVMKPKRKRWAWDMVGIVILLLIALGAWFYLGHSRMKQASSEKSSSGSDCSVNTVVTAQTECLEKLGFTPDTPTSEHFVKCMETCHEVHGGVDWDATLKLVKELKDAGQTPHQMQETLGYKPHVGRR